MTALLRFDKVSKTYGTVPALNKLSLEIEKGEFVYVRAQQEDGGMAWSSPIYAR